MNSLFYIKKYRKAVKYMKKGHCISLYLSLCSTFSTLALKKAFTEHQKIQRMAKSDFVMLNLVVRYKYCIIA